MQYKLKLKEFEIEADDILNNDAPLQVRKLVDLWIEELKDEGFEVVTPIIDLEVIDSMDPGPRTMRFIVSLGVEEIK